MSKTKNSKISKMKNLEKARETKKIKKQARNIQFPYSKIKEYIGKVKQGTLKNLLIDLPNSIYEPSLKKMTKKYFENSKRKLSASLIYEHIYNLSPNLKNDLYEIGKNLHSQFEIKVKHADIISEFPTGISTQDFYWITAKPDGIIGSDKGNFLIELKTLTKTEFDLYSQTTKNINTISDSILYQVKLYMVIFKISKCFLCLFCIETERKKILTINSELEDFEFFRNTFKLFVKKNAEREGIKFSKIGKRLFSKKKFNYPNKLKRFKGNFPYRKIKQHLMNALNELVTPLYLLKGNSLPELNNREINESLKKQMRERNKIEYKIHRLKKKLRYGYW